MPTDEDGFFYAEPNPAREKEKKELMALTDAEASLLPFSVQYQRMRYFREIEGMEFVRREQEAARLARERKKGNEFEPKTMGNRSTRSRKEWDRGLDKD